MQKRLVRKLDLEMLLAHIKPHPSPKPSLEQYTIPTDFAATMLYIATYTNNDIAGRTVLDLGCGTGRLALGAAFLGAKQVVGVDIDKAAIKAALENSVTTRLKNKTQWIAADVNVIHGKFDTVLQNPPFGVQTRKADRKFLKTALEVGKIVYSLHKDPRRDKQLIKQLKTNRTNIMLVSPSPFIKKFVETNGGKVKAVYAMPMTIPHLFNFHMKRKHEFLVDLYIIEAN
jgi:putative methylase